MENTKNISRDSPIVAAIREAYGQGQEDEALEPLIAVDSSGQPIGRYENGDSVIFYDTRGEREVELTQSLTDPSFDHFPVEKNLCLHFVTMIEYASSLPTRVAFPPEGEVKNTFSEIVSLAGMRLLKIAESEKAIHVGYFMNGKREIPFAGEERIVVPSPENVTSYASTPEMNALQVTTEVCNKVHDFTYPVIVANLANVDVIGHMEEREAVLKAVEAVDRALGKILQACRDAGRTLVVTADHGTVEEWLYPDGTVNTGHTKNPVPFVLADFSSPRPAAWKLKERGELIDVAPTLLDLMGIRKPEGMTGSNLILNFFSQEGRHGKILLLILDGWGMRKEEHGNLIRQSSTPNFNHIWSRFPHTLLEASGEAVGMPPDTVGNSEAGHLHLGAGRHIVLDRVRIDTAIQEGQFFKNPAFLWAMDTAKKNGRALHLLGIVSHYSSHGTLEHLFALLRLAQKRAMERVYVHALIGRRGEKPESGAIYVAKVEEMCRKLSLGQVVTVMGRFWALDREHNWDRVEKTYRALVRGEGTCVHTQQR